MSTSASVVVFDTSPLRHFALAGWLGVLKFLTRDSEVVIPASVRAELAAQSSSDPSLKQVLNAEWISTPEEDDVEILVAFAQFERRLVVDDRNLGECGVLALGKARGWKLVIDDGAARQIAKEEKLEFTGTLGLLVQGIQEGRLTVAMVEDLADDLITGEYRLPFKRGGFRAWADGEGLL